MFSNDPYAFKQLDDQTYQIARAIPSDVPNDYKRVAYIYLKQELGSHLIEILEHGKLPATIDILETRQVEGDFFRPLDVVRLTVTIVPVKHMHNIEPSGTTLPEKWYGDYSHLLPKKKSWWKRIFG